MVPTQRAYRLNPTAAPSDIAPTLAELLHKPLPAPLQTLPRIQTTRFNPTPTHATSKQSQVQLQVVLASPVYLSGGLVHGHLELHRPAYTWMPLEVRAGEAVATLSGHEEMSQTLLHWIQGSTEQRTFVTMQQQILSAPHRELDDDAVGYRHVRKGRSCYQFSFQLPMDLPSSFDSRYAAIRYHISGMMRLRINGDIHVLVHHQEVTVVQQLNLDFLKPFRGSMDLEQQVQLVPKDGRSNRAEGVLTLACSVGKSCFIAGTLMHLSLRIINNTNRKLAYGRVCLMRDIHFIASRRKKAITSSKMLQSQRISYVLDAGDEISFVMEVPIPSNERTILNAHHIGLTHRVHIALGVESKKDLTMNIPIGIFHTLSLESVTPSLGVMDEVQDLQKLVLPREFRDQRGPQLPRRAATFPRMKLHLAVASDESADTIAATSDTATANTASEWDTADDGFVYEFDHDLVLSEAECVEEDALESISFTDSDLRLDMPPVARRNSSLCHFVSTPFVLDRKPSVSSHDSIFSSHPSSVYLAHIGGSCSSPSGYEMISIVEQAAGSLSQFSLDHVDTEDQDLSYYPHECMLPALKPRAVSAYMEHSQSQLMTATLHEPPAIPKRTDASMQAADEVWDQISAYCESALTIADDMSH